jgi:hypothetical protein
MRRCLAYTSRSCLALLRRPLRGIQQPPGASRPLRGMRQVAAHCLSLALICRPRLGSHVRLARASPRSFARHDRAAQEQFAPPDSPGLPPLQRSGEAGGPRRALPAQGLGQLHVIRRLGEVQLRVICAGQVRTGTRDRQRRGESGCWHALPGRCGRVRSSARSGNLAGVLVRPAPVTLVGPARE